MFSCSRDCICPRLSRLPRLCFCFLETLLSHADRVFPPRHSSFPIRTMYGQFGALIHAVEQIDCPRPGYRARIDRVKGIGQQGLDI